MIVVDCVQGTLEWAEARRGIATASRFSNILTDKKQRFSESGALTYICELLAERIVPPHYWIGKDFASGPMRNGTNTEGEARSYFELVRGCDVEQVGFIQTDDGRLGCSPDSLVGSDSGLELKCPLHKTQVKYLLDPCELVDEYRAQCHGAMIVTKRSTWHLMSYAVGLPPVIHTFQVDDYTVKLAAALDRFNKLYDELAIKLNDLGDPVAATREPVESYF